MKKPAIFLTVALLSGGVVSAQSLGDLAREEAKRREQIPQARVIEMESAPPTEAKKGANAADKAAAAKANDKASASGKNNASGAIDTKDGGDGRADCPEGAACPADEENEENAADEKKDPNEPTDLNGKTASYWRQAMSAARSKVTELENQERELTLARNDLQTRFYRADGVRRGALQKEIQKNIYEQDQTRENLTKAREELQTLRNQASASGALPGWLD